jgi:hypothetical protein
VLYRYAAAAAGAAALGAWTPLGGAMASVLLVALLLTARAAKALFANRRGDRGGLVQDASDLARLVPLIALLDAATAAGTIDWLLGDAGRPAG